MSDDDRFWGAPAPEPPRGARRRRWTRIAAPAAIALAASAGCVALALVAWLAAPSAPDLPLPAKAAAGPAAVVAHIALGPADRRTLDEICADYDVPAGLCEASRACPPASGGARVVTLVLRPGEGGCSGERR